MELQAFRYIDQNNNTFRGNPQQLSYRPIQAKESSSGFYSGGEASEVALQKDQWTNIQNFIKAIIDNESLHLDKRQMLTMRLQITTTTQKQSWIIRRAEEQAALETYLRQLLRT